MLDLFFRFSPWTGRNAANLPRWAIPRWQHVHRALPTSSPTDAAPARTAVTRRSTSRLRVTSLQVFCAVLGAALLLRGQLAEALDGSAVRIAATVFVAVCVQALPFLVLGVLLSGLIAAFVSPAALGRLLPRRAALAVPMAGLAGAVLPGCECASVPVARRLIGRGCRTPPRWRSAGRAGDQPVVLVATAVAFPRRTGDGARPVQRVAGHRGGMGWLWNRFGRAEWIAERGAAAGAPRLRRRAWWCSWTPPGTTWSPPAGSWCSAG